MTVIKIKNSNVSGRLPASGDIEIAELALNIADQKLYSKDAAGAIFEIGVAGDIPSGITPPTSGNNNGDLYFDTATGRLLYWDGSGWQTVVKASGDNFTGDVTLGTDKITLDATAGNASFAGTIRVNNSSGDVQAYLQNDGSINAAWGQLSSGLSTYISGGDGKHYIGWDGTLGNEKILFDPAIGSAIFSGGVSVTRQTASQTILAAYLGTSPDSIFKVVANGDVTSKGSATFDGNLISGEDPTDGNNQGFKVSGGSVIISRPNGYDAFNVFANGNSTSKIKLKSDGTANFSGSVESTVDNAYAFKVNGGGFFSNTGGGIGLYMKEANKTFPIGSWNDADNNKLEIGNGSATIWQTITLDGTDGSATFDGTVTATVVPPSDARFKENIEPAKPQLADVVALGGLLKNYDWNDQAPLNEELRSQRQLGLIAQEAAEVCPAIVKDIHRTQTVEVTPAVLGPKGRVITEAVTQEVDDSYKGISQEALIMKLIGAVAELSAEVTALKAAKTTKK